MLLALRAYLERQVEVPEWKLLRAPANPFVFDSDQVEEAAGEMAFYNPSLLVIHFGPTVTARLDAVRAGDRRPNALSGVRTAIHELVHAMSPMLHAHPFDHRSGVGRLVEEGIAEHRARRLVVRDVLGMTDYRPLMDDPGWAGFFSSRTLEANGLYAVAHVCGEAIVDALAVATDPAERDRQLSSAVAKAVCQRLRSLGADASTLAGVEPPLVLDGYKLLMDTAASPPFEQRRPEHVPLMALWNARELAQALEALYFSGVKVGVLR